MEIVFEALEALFDLIISCFDITKNKNKPKSIRYFCIFLLAILILLVIGLIMFLIIYLFQKNILLGMIAITVILLLLILFVLKLKNMYLDKKKSIK